MTQQEKDFAAMDADHSGAVDLQEYATQHAKTEKEKQAAMDAAEREEMAEQAMEGFRIRFEEMDADGDGKVTMKEYLQDPVVAGTDSLYRSANERSEKSTALRAKRREESAQRAEKMKVDAAIRAHKQWDRAEDRAEQEAKEEERTKLQVVHMKGALANITTALGPQKQNEIFQLEAIIKDWAKKVQKQTAVQELMAEKVRGAHGKWAVTASAHKRAFADLAKARKKVEAELMAEKVLEKKLQDKQAEEERASEEASSLLQAEHERRAAVQAAKGQVLLLTEKL